MDVHGKHRTLVNRVDKPETDRRMLDLSVIIPVLDEADALPRLLRQLQSQRDIRLDVVVADGGSTDGSRQIASLHGARVVASRPGRARQMNVGAEAARYDRLLFLHGDSGIRDNYLLAKALTAWQTRCSRTGGCQVAGHFRLSFERSHGHERAYRYLEEKSATNRPQTINGDQGLLIHRTFFNRLGGFDERFPFMEDQRIAQDIFDAGQWMLLPGHVTTSARRFETEGFYRRYTLMGIMMAFYWTGAGDFFTEARNLYPAQSRSRSLQLWPFYKLTWRLLLRDRSLKAAVILAFRLGRYLRQNIWQFFFVVDINLLPAKTGHSHPCTRFYDRFLESLSRNRLADLVATIVLLVGYALAGPLLFLLDAALADGNRKPDASPQ